MYRNNAREAPVEHGPEARQTADGPLLDIAWLRMALVMEALKFVDREWNVL